MLKKLLLVVSTFAIVVLLFLIYQWQDSTPRRKPASPTSRPAMAMATSRPAGENEARLNIKGVEVPPGQKPAVKVFDSKGREKIRFKSEEWRPISETEWHMTRLEARLLLPGSQIIYVTADEGQIVVSRDDNDNYTPKRGWLQGRVHLIIDQTDEKWRNEHPEQALPDQHPDYLVHLWVDRVTFDLDMSRLESPSDLKVSSRDAVVEGTGLTLVWNEVDRRIDLLEIGKGKRMELRRNADFVQFAVPGGDPTRHPKKADKGGEPATDKPVFSTAAGKPEPVPDPLAEDKSPTSRSAGEELFLDLTRDRQVKRRPKQAETYLAKFDGGVQIEQRRGELMEGRLTSDLLEILFDFGDKQREATEVTPKRKESAATQAASQPSMPAATTSAPVQQTRIQLVWSGKLSMAPVERVKDPQAGERLHATASGHVRVERDRAGAECDRLVFANESEQVELYGSPAKLHENENRTIEGEKIFYDRRNGLARIDGKGRMSDTRGLGQAMDLPGSEREADSLADGSDVVNASWSKGVDLAFGTTPQTRTDPQTGRQVVSQKEYLKHARFRGDVNLSRGRQGMNADDVELIFTEPKAESAPPKSKEEPADPNAAKKPKDRSLNAQLDRMIARGRVSFQNTGGKAQSDQGTVTADELVVVMGTDVEGKLVPVSADARGNVTAKQEDRLIEASDRLTVKFGYVSAPLPPIDRKAAIPIARSRGLDPDKIDWDALDLKRRNNRDMEIVELEAYKDVAAVDPSEKLQLSADELHCWMPQGRQKFEKAVIVGSPQRAAEVEQRGYYIRGPRIVINAQTQYAEVPSAGLLRFLSKEDLDGRRLDEAVPVTVAWSKHMVMDGANNKGVFVGDVHAVSRNNVLDCSQLDLTFEDIPATVAESQPATAPATQYWVIGPMVDRVAKMRAKDRADTGSLGMRKRPVFLLAKQDARVTSTTHDPKDPSRILSRMHVDGPELAVDIVSSQMTVNGAGNLLIEDYRMPIDKKRPRPVVQASRNPFAANIDMEGPSRTAFRWQNAMSFFAQRNMAVLDRDVLMVHLSGGELKLTPQEAKAMKIDVERLQMAKGRRASLRTDNLVVQFVRDPERAKNANDPTPMAGATELAYLCATGNSRLEEGTRSVQGEVITYNKTGGTIRVTRSVDAPAKFVDLDERTGVYNIASGDSLSYNVETGQLEGTGFTASATGK